jgi:uncharacterized membrane protein YfcA
VITDPVFYYVAIPAVIALGLSKGGFSGIGTLSTPVLALVVPPGQAAGILLPILMAQDVVTLWAYRRDWDGWNLAVLIPGLAIGMAIGWLMAAYVPDAYARIAVGLVAVVFVLNYWIGRRPEDRPGRPPALKGVFWGTISGISSFLAHVGGPPFQIFVLPQRLPKDVFVGTLSVYFAAANAMKVAPYFALGQLSNTNLTTSLALLPLAVVANLFGVWLVRRTAPERFYKIIYLLILLVGLELIRQGVVALPPA